MEMTDFCVSPKSELKTNYISYFFCDISFLARVANLDFYLNGDFLLEIYNCNKSLKYVLLDVIF